jgi:hypothetical protein
LASPDDLPSPDIVDLVSSPPSPTTTPPLPTPPVVSSSSSSYLLESRPIPWSRALSL